MGASLVLRPSRLAVEPGVETTLEAVVRNLGTVVDQFTISVVGEAGEWAEALPADVSLFPNAEETVRVTFRPPRSSQVQAGEVPFGVRVSSREDPEGSTVEEGVIDVGRFFDVGAELVPQASQGRKRGKHDVAVDNRGNSRLPITLQAFDENDFLRFELNPPELETAPGTAGFSKLRVKARKGFWTGPVKTHPFRVVASSNGQVDPQLVPGTFLQRPRIPRWLPRAIVALLALAALGVLAWFLLLKPTVESAAKDAVEEPLAAQAAAQRAKDAAQDKQLSDQAKAIEGVTGSPLPPQPSPAPVADVGLGDPIDGRLFTSRLQGQGAGPNNSQNSYVVPAGATVSLTDLVIGNAEADSGVVTIQRNTSPLLQLRLENFRDLDYHFVSPIVFRAGDRLRLSVICENEGASDPCTPSLYFSGFSKTS